MHVKEKLDTKYADSFNVNLLINIAFLTSIMVYFIPTFKHSGTNLEGQDDQLI